MIYKSPGTVLRYFLSDSFILMHRFSFGVGFSENKLTLIYFGRIRKLLQSETLHQDVKYRKTQGKYLF